MKTLKMLLLVLAVSVLMHVNADAQKVTTTHWQTLKDGSLVDKCLRSRTTTNAAGVVIKDEQWFDNAQLAMIRTWDNDGKQSGTWLEYNSLGQLLCKRSYDSKGREVYQELYTDNGKYQCRLKHTIAYDNNGYEYTVSKYELVGRIDRITGEDNRKFMQTAGKTGSIFWEISPIGEMYSERTSDGTCTVWTDKTKAHIITKAWNADNGRYELTTHAQQLPNATWVPNDAVQSKCFNSKSFQWFANYDTDGNVIKSDSVWFDSNNRKYKLKNIKGKTRRVYTEDNSYLAICDESGDEIYVTNRSAARIPTGIYAKRIEDVFGKPNDALCAKYGGEPANDTLLYNALLTSTDNFAKLRQNVKIVEQARTPQQLTANYVGIKSNIAATIYELLEDIKTSESLGVATIDASKYAQLAQIANIQKVEKVRNNVKVKRLSGGYDYQDVKYYEYECNIAKPTVAFASTCVSITDDDVTTYYNCRDLEQLNDNTESAQLTSDMLLLEQCNTQQFVNELNAAVKQYNAALEASGNKKAIRSQTQRNNARKANADKANAYSYGR